jgi:hypothetical protein
MGTKTKLLRSKNVSIRLAQDEIKTVKLALDVAIESLAEWNTDPKCDAEDKRWGKRRSREFTRLLLKLSGYTPNQSAGRNIISFPQLEGLNGDAAEA